MKITILYTEGSGVDYHRLLAPAKHLGLHGDVQITYVKHSECPQNEEAFNCDILYYSTLFYYHTDKLKALKKKYNFKIVLDVDDHPQPCKYQMHHPIWKKYNLEQELYNHLPLADLVFVTTKQLKEIYTPYNNNIVVVPNGLYFDEHTSEAEMSDRIRFIYVGGNNHEYDFKTIRNLFKWLNKNKSFQEKGSFTLCGYSNPTKDTWIFDRMEEIGKNCGQYVRRDLMTLQTYTDHYNYGDIAIAPLRDNAYNDCKSNLKFIEAALKRKPLICFNRLPYIIDKDAKGIIFCEDLNDWKKAFQFFLDNPEKVKEFGDANYDYAISRYNLHEINKIRYKALVDILDVYKYIRTVLVPVKKYY